MSVHKRLSLHLRWSKKASAILIKRNNKAMDTW